MPTRDSRIDVLRALCVVSMTIGHLLGSTGLSTVLHPFVFVDGAAGFVACSAVVLGMVQRRFHDRRDRPGAHRLLLRRLGLLYGSHVGLVAVAVLARTFLDQPAFVPAVDDLGGLGDAVAHILLLQVQPPFLNVLPLYVFFLLLAHPLVLALSARGSLVVLAASAGIYWWQRDNGGLAGPDLVWGAETTFSWGGWQLLFVVGLLAGWHWTAVQRFGATIAGRAAIVVAVLSAVGLGALAQAWRLGHAPFWLVVWFEKYSFQPMMLPFTVVVAVTGYWAVGRLGGGAIGDALLRQLATIGARPFFCFLTLLVTEVVARSLQEEISTTEGAVLATGVLVVGWLGGTAKQRRRTDAAPVAAAPLLTGRGAA